MNIREERRETWLIKFNRKEARGWVSLFVYGQVQNSAKKEAATYSLRY